MVPSKREPWEAEIEVTPDLATHLIATQFPDFGECSLERLGNGWDNVAYVVNDAYVFRFPRRAIAAELIGLEVRVLPLIAPELPLPISAPRFAGVAGDRYPWPFAGYPMLRGTPLTALRPDMQAYTRLAATLGSFLRALHAIDVTPLLAVGLGGDTIGRLDHRRGMPRTLERLNALQANGLIDDVAPIVAFLETVAPVDPRNEALTLVHGDFYARHILLDGEHRVSGVIDWGDAHFGDPALDISVAFGVLPPQARSAFFDAYGAVDERTRALARYRALYAGAMIGEYGRRIGDDDLVRAGLTGLHDALS